MSYEGPRGAKKEELEAVVSLVSDTFSGGPRDKISSGYLMFMPENAENLRIMLYEGRPVTHVGLKEFEIAMCGCELKLACVGGVCSAPEHRKQGLASRVLEDAWERLRQAAVDFVMISGDRGLYWRAGASRCSPTVHFEVLPEAAEAASNASLCESDRFAEQAPELLRIYENEPVHWKRSVEQLRKITASRPEIEERAILALWDEAYLLGWLKNENDETWIDIQEYAGDRGRLLAEIPNLAAARGMRLRLRVPAWDETLVLGLSKSGREAGRSNFPESTIKVLSLDRLMEKTKPFWVSKIGEQAAAALRFEQTGEIATISCKGKRLDFKGQEIGELVFGTIEPREWAKQSPALREALGKIFPLPAPRYGVNYL